jgi:hypothetical protein
MKHLLITLCVAVALVTLGCAKNPTAVEPIPAGGDYYQIMSASLVDAHINTTTDSLSFRVVPVWSMTVCTTLVAVADIVISTDSTLYHHTADTASGSELLFVIPITPLEYWPGSMAVDVKIVYAGKEYYTSLATEVFITTTK